MDRRLVLILALALVLCPSIGWYLANDSFHRDTILPVANSAPPPRPLFTGTEADIFATEMHEKEPVIITLGGPPLSQLPYSQGGRGPGYSDLSAFIAANTDWMMETYFYPEGPIIGLGYDSEMYLDVRLLICPLPRNPYTVDELYAMLDERAQSMGIENIPVRMRIHTSPPVLVLHGQ
jgi:hypothetical protein